MRRYAAHCAPAPDGSARAWAAPAGAVLSALRKALALADGTEELTARHGDDWCGIPLRFAAGQPVACLPDLDADEDAQLSAATTKLRTTYQALRLSRPTPTRLETT
ncbi:hypothetical protein [Streptomyces sp. Rer75]|uniref:hypothetical protein n=1 Tax=unclassified Streptomyces TaxID=2593676 RepID=UPI00211DD34B|nr:hypothetical protein [Streptomyces sp. Rer75]